MLERNAIIEQRIKKIRELRERGINPFVNRFVPSHKSSEILKFADDFIKEEREVVVAGRVLTIRSFGKASFFHLQDGEGKIQIYIKQGITSPESADFLKKWVDTGDFVGIKGIVFRTKTGEVTVAGKELTLLTKSIKPLPEKWHGLRDTEIRYRCRYLDLIVNDSVKKTFETRSRIISSIRRFLDAKGYLEVETPMMHSIYGGANARPFITYHNALNMNLYLRIAPELYLKRLTIGGFDKVYEINRNFRNEGISTVHNPEFTMLELYTAYWDYTDTMELVEEMIKNVAKEVLGSYKFQFQGETIDLEPEWKRITMLDSIKEITGVDFKWSDSIEEVRRKARDIQNLQEPSAPIKSPEEMIYFIFENIVEPTLIQPTFIKEFPKSLSPLSKVKEGDPLVAERFETFIGHLEIGNAYSELNDPEDQYERFLEQMKKFEAGDTQAGMMDEDYVMALEQGMPPTSGLGIGIDRLVMLFTNSSSIRDVILFPLMRQRTQQELEEEMKQISSLSEVSPEDITTSPNISQNHQRDKEKSEK